MNTELIKLFSCALIEQPTLDFAAVNQLALERGYLVHPDVCNRSVEQFLLEQTVNYNATFYKRWQDVVERSREELYFDQILHYLTTYGTDYKLGQGYVPNDNILPPLPYNEYKVIMPITVEELAAKCIELLQSGIALKYSTMHVCADQVIQTVGKQIDVDSIKNREAQTYICDKLNIAPQEKFALLRYIIFKTTGETLIIKNNSLRNRIMRSENRFDLTTLNTQQLKSLASIYLRYKPLFLAFKKRLEYNNSTREFLLVQDDKNSKVVNKLRRMARKEHKPMPSQYWASILVPQDLSGLELRLPEITLFKVVALMQLIKQRLIELSELEIDRLYIVRNQKLWLRHYDDLPKEETDYLKELYNLLEGYLVKKLSQKACVTKFPVGYSLALPSSEKSFVGQLPFGTKYDLSTDNFIGIYWRNEWGTRDFDLSIVDVNGQKIGWNSEFYDDEHNIIFSGDMTNAEPEASEVMCFRQGCKEAMIYVNRYNGDAGSKYKLFFGRENIRVLSKNYMVNPASVCLTADMESEDDRQQAVGLIFDNTVTLMQLSFGKGRVSNNRTELLSCMKRKAMSFIDAEQILRKAGFREPTTTISNGEEHNEMAELDLTNLDRSTLLTLLS